MWVERTQGASWATAATGIIQPHQQVAGVQGDTESTGIESIQQVEQLGGREVGMVLDRQLQIQVQEPGSQQGQDLQCRLDLGRPGYVGAKPIVPITHVDSGMPAAEGGNPFEVGTEHPCKVAGRKRLTPLARSAHGIWRR